LISNPPDTPLLFTRAIGNQRDNKICEKSVHS
jgi:hypothetical protein